MAESTHVRWPTEWRVRGFGWVTSDELAEGQCYTVEVDVPSGDDGGPDFQGLLARLRLDPAEAEALRAEVERLRERLAELDIATLLRDIAWHAREGDLGGFERLVCAASHLEALADEIDAALAERGGGR